MAYEDADSGPPSGDKTPDTAIPAYKYAKTLTHAAMEAQKKDFQVNWNKFMGRYNWVSPVSGGARTLAAWCFQGVVNWTYATIKTKASMILGAPSEIHVEPLDDGSSYYDRLLVKSAEEHLLKSVRFEDIRRDAFISGSVTGVGVSMWQYRPDPITGAMKLVAVPIKTSEFFRDPSADSITSPDCRFVVWSTHMDMSRAREIFMGKAQDIKPDGQSVQGPGGITYSTPDDSNLIYGVGQYIQDPAKNAATRKAKINFVWVKDESLIEELRDVLVSEEQPGVFCASCGQTYEVDAVENVNECPTCLGPMENVTIPSKMRTDSTIKRAYPYGRLIVYTGGTLLYDGQNPSQLECVFPFGVYHHDRVPGEFLGANDVELLDSLQDAQNRTIGQIMDAVRLSFNGPFEYPMGCKSYTDMGVGPGERHPVPDHLAGKAHFVAPQGQNISLGQLALGAIKEQFIIVSGLGGPSLGEVSSPPISATEAEIANSRLSDRMRAHAREFASYSSDFAEIGRQLAVQFLDEQMTVPVHFPDSTTKDLAIEWKKLPNVRVRVTINQQEAVRDKQIGQNITLGIQNGILDSPYAELYLNLVGATPAQIREVMDKKALAQELQGQQAPQGPPPLELLQGGQDGNDEAPAGL